MDTPSDPVITPCGHLFCWGCLVNWLDLDHDDCPVCKGHVTRDNVTPIYGVDGENKDPRSDSHTPKRPSAHYEESDHTRNNRAQHGFFNAIPGLMFPSLMSFRVGSSNFSFGFGMPMFSIVSLVFFLFSAVWNWYRSQHEHDQNPPQGQDQDAPQDQSQEASQNQRQNDQRRTSHPSTTNVDAFFIILIVVVLILYTVLSCPVC